jgi:hypothetical protein
MSTVHLETPTVLLVFFSASIVVERQLQVLYRVSLRTDPQLVLRLI